MIVAAHQTMLAPQSGASSLDYVQTGLIGMWDGIENAGRGVHRASATAWKDLSGNGMDAAAPSGCALPTWGELGPVFSQQNSSAPEMLQFTASSALKSATAATIELVFNMVDTRPPNLPTGSTNEMILHILPVGNYPYKGRFSFRYNCFTNPAENAASYMGDNSTQTQIYRLNSVSNPFHPSVAFTFSTTNARGLFYYNGVARSGAQAQPWIGILSSATYGNIGGATGMGTFPNGYFIGTLNAIRIYNRALSASEIAINYAIDKVRFNLP